MNYRIATEGFVHEKVLNKALQKLQRPIHWRKTKRMEWLKSCRITDCFRLIQLGDSHNLLLMDHKHYNRYLAA